MPPEDTQEVIVKCLDSRNNEESNGFDINAMETGKLKIIYYIFILIEIYIQLLQSMTITNHSLLVIKIYFL